MNLEETLKDLNELGAQYIHEKTHISLFAINAILRQDFTAIHPIQYSGFLNIIEAELHMNMEPLRTALKEHNNEHNISAEQEQLFVYPPAVEKNKKVLFGLIAAVVIAFLLIFSLSDSDESVEVVETSSAVTVASESIEKNKSDTGDTVVEENTIARFNPKEANADSFEADHPFVLFPKGDLWIGTIDIDTKTKKDTITNKPYALDENVNMLISLGHGQVRIVLNGETLVDSNSTRRLRYLYKDGKLTRIMLSEFKELNDGNSW